MPKDGSVVLGRVREQHGLLGEDAAFELRTVRLGEAVAGAVVAVSDHGLSFHVSQAFFPRTSAWDNLRRALKGEFEESVWDHLSGTVSAPFAANGSREVAVKVIDDRGNELLVIKRLDEAL